MLIVVSPAKSLELEKPFAAKDFTMPFFLKEAEALIPILQKLKAPAIGKLMDISPKLADLNYDRFQAFHTPYTPENARPSLFTFDGDVYTGLDAFSMKKKEIDFAQKHLRILSGLYGLLRPLDLMQAYRLEMGTELKNKKGKNLYEYWGDSITQRINEEMELLKTDTLINLASIEYFSAVKAKKIKGNIITCQFKEKKGNAYKIISFNAKKARGTMARFIISNQLKKVSDIQAFDLDGYQFSASMSKADEWVFIR